jgi:hypothetical protein
VKFIVGLRSLKCLISGILFLSHEVNEAAESWPRFIERQKLLIIPTEVEKGDLSS